MEDFVIAGKEDFLKPYGEELLKSVVNPVIIHHPKGHTVPRISESISSYGSMPSQRNQPTSFNLCIKPYILKDTNICVG